MYATDTPLPDWLAPLDGRPFSYVADPDLFYPVILKLMGITVKAATRWDMETANGLAKKLAQWHSKRCQHGFVKNLLIRGDGGRKAKWAIRTQRRGAGSLEPPDGVVRFAMEMEKWQPTPICETCSAMIR